MVVCHIFRHTMTHPKFHLAKMLQDAVRCPAAAACLPTFCCPRFQEAKHILEVAGSDGLNEALKPLHL